MNNNTRNRWIDIYMTAAALWCIFGIVFHFVMLRRLIQTGGWGVALTALAVWWAITLIAGAIRRSIEKSVKAKADTRAAEYREKYITEIVVEDERFGRVVLEHDTKENTVSIEEYPLEKPFGRHEEVLLTAETDGGDASAVAASLVYLYRNSREILEMMYRYTLECCENYEERNSGGEPYDMEYVRANLYLYGITIVNYDDHMHITLDGSISGDDGSELLGCHGITADIELTMDDPPRRKKIYCGLVG